MAENLYPTGQDIVDYIVRNDLLNKRCDSVASGDASVLTFAGPERQLDRFDEYGEPVMDYTDFLLDLETGVMTTDTWYSDEKGGNNIFSKEDSKCTS